MTILAMLALTGRDSLKVPNGQTQQFLTLLFLTLLSEQPISLGNLSFFD